LAPETVEHHPKAEVNLKVKVESAQMRITPEIEPTHVRITPEIEPARMRITPEVDPTQLSLPFSISASTATTPESVPATTDDWIRRSCSADEQRQLPVKAMLRKIKALAEQLQANDYPVSESTIYSAIERMGIKRLRRPRRKNP
jgi:hypothetical protein